MRYNLATPGFLILVGTATVVAIAQPPAPLPSFPQTVPANPTGPIAVPQVRPATTPAIPANLAAQDTPLSHFEPLAAFPPQTQMAVRGVLLSANWLTRMNQSHGRFIFGFNPALKQPLVHEDELAQARAALAMAQFAKFTGEERQAAVASQAILSLKTKTKIDPNDAKSSLPIPSPTIVNRVAFAATLALAIYALPSADGELQGEAERLCEFIRKQCRPDGSVNCLDASPGPAKENDASCENEYAGLAFQALLAGNRFRPQSWKTELTYKGLGFYRGVFQTKPHPLSVASLTPAFTELYLQTKSLDAAAAVFEMNDWLCRLQIPGNDPRLSQNAGGFRCPANGKLTDGPYGYETGLFLQCLSCACQVAHLTPDLDRHKKFKNAAIDATQFLVELQYVETNTRHFESAFRANMLIGAFHQSPTDGNVRIDATAIASTGLIQFLTTVADRD